MENETSCPLWFLHNLTNSSSTQLLFNHAVMGVLISLYILVGLFSICGNSAVLYIVASKKDMRTVTNLFICNLAFSDLIVTLSSLWMTPLDIYLDRWILGGFMCYFSQIIPGVSIFVSTFTLTGIAIDRYILIMYPVRTRISSGQCTGTMISIWLVSLIMVLPVLLHITYREVPPCYSFCLEDWDFAGSLWYAIIVLFIKTIVPFLLLTLCYWRIAVKLQDQQKRLHGRRTSARDVSEVDRKKRLNRILTAMVAIFLICSLPFDGINLLKDIRDYLHPHPDQRQAFFGTDLQKPSYLLAHLLAMTATLWNPLIRIIVEFESNSNRSRPLGISFNKQRTSSGRSKSGSSSSNRRSDGDSHCLLRKAEPTSEQNSWILAKYISVPTTCDTDLSSPPRCSQLPIDTEVVVGANGVDKIRDPSDPEGGCRGDENGSLVEPEFV